MQVFYSKHKSIRIYSFNTLPAAVASTQLGSQNITLPINTKFKIVVFILFCLPHHLSMVLQASEAHYLSFPDFLNLLCRYMVELFGKGVGRHDDSHYAGQRGHTPCPGRRSQGSDGRQQNKSLTALQL